jgi:Protein of unknown function (DUF3828)
MQHSWKLLLLTLAVLAVPAIAAPAAPQSAEAYLKSIYAHYNGNDDTTAKGIFLDKDADYRRYFTKDLADLMIADEKTAAKNGDVPSLDGDPFIDAQDWNITHLTIHVDSETAHDAKATIRFKNDKEAKVVHAILKNTADGWRFSDIIWNGNEGSLRGLYVKTK